MSADVTTAGGHRAHLRAPLLAMGRDRRARQQRRRRARSRHRGHHRRRVAGSVRLHPVPGDSRQPRLAVPSMRARGGGAIIMIASIWGRESGGRMTYNAVKASRSASRNRWPSSSHPTTSASTASRPARSCSRAGRGGSGSRPTPRRWPSSCVASCPSAASAGAEEVGDAVAFLASARGQLDQRRERDGGRLPVAVAHLRLARRRIRIQDSGFGIREAPLIPRKGIR